MKESRIITFISIILIILIISLSLILEKNLPGIYDYQGIASNLCCGLVVGLVTSICQYFVYRRKIINNIYNLYFDIYRTWYNSSKNRFLWHYNIYDIYKKIMELNPKINDNLDEYHGLFRKKDRIYKKLNPDITLSKSYKAKNIIKLYLFWFNKKQVNEIIEPFINEVEIILKGINKKKFEKDVDAMKKMHNFLWDK